MASAVVFQARVGAAQVNPNPLRILARHFYGLIDERREAWEVNGAQGFHERNVAVLGNFVKVGKYARVKERGIPTVSRHTPFV